MAQMELDNQMNETIQPNADDGVAVVYDGECPFCARYVSMLRLKAVAGKVELIDARSDDPLANWARNEFDLDNGMAVRLHGDWQLGSNAMNALAILTGPSSTMNRIHYAIFRHKRLSRFLYPMLRGGRNLILRILRRRKIADDFPNSGQNQSK